MRPTQPRRGDMDQEGTMRRRLCVAATVAALVLLATAGAAQAEPAAPPPDRPSLKVIVLLRPHVKGARIAAELRADAAQHVVRYHLIPALAATVSRSTLEDLRTDPRVLRVVNDGRVAVPQIPELAGAGAAAGVSAAAPALESEALQLTHAEEAWQLRAAGQPVMGQGVRVGMIDSGVDRTHPDLEAAIESYRDFTGTGLRDAVGHGTSTAGTIAAQGKPVYNPSTGTMMRVAGMAPGARILMAKVIDEHGGLDSNLIRGIEWLVDADVDMISCSLGSMSLPADGTDPVALAAQAATDAGITFVTSAGNEGPGQGTTDDGTAANSGMLAVGATTGNRMLAQLGVFTSGDAYRGDQVISWSSRGPNALGEFRPDIMGFGAWGWALAPVAAGGIGTFGGTSMAAPVVAGNLALAQSAYRLRYPWRRLPAPAYWKTLLTSTASDLGYPALDQSAGLVNAAAAVKAVLKQGKATLVSVASSHGATASWSARVAAGAKTTTTLTVSNSGAVKTTVKLAATRFVRDDGQTITRALELSPSTWYDEAVAVPDGAELVQVSCTWPSGPEVTLETVVYDSDDNLVAIGPTYGGYGHLSLAQVSLAGPEDQRPVVRDGAPWTVRVLPPTGLAAHATQPATLRIEFLHEAPWPSVRLSATRLRLARGQKATVKATVTAPQAAGTSFGAIAVSNGATRTTIPVAVRVPVAMKGNWGTFAGTLSGSTIQYSGGELYSYDVVVPPETGALQASVTWPDQGNLVNLYLVAPDGRVCNAKGGDLWSIDYTDGTVPPEASTHTAEQVVWHAPEPGTWRLLVWAPGFSGNGFEEPFSGRVSFTRGAVSPTHWTTVARPGETRQASFFVGNPGPTALPVYAESQVVIDGEPRFRQQWYAGELGPLSPASIWAFAGFPVPQETQQIQVDVSWPDAAGSDEMVDANLYDPTGTSAAVGLATLTDGNSMTYEAPMAGLWTLGLAYLDPAAAQLPLTAVTSVGIVSPAPLTGFASSATQAAPLLVPAQGSGGVSVTVTVPEDATPGESITGVVRFYSTGGAGERQIAGGDHLGSVPVRITVAAP